MSAGSASQRFALGVLVCLLAGALLVSFALSGGGASTLLLRGHTVTVALSEYSITPQSISLPAGAIRIVAYNRGVIVHNLTISYARLDSKGERVILHSTHAILPGSSRTLSFEIPPGRYAMASTIANQADLGMTGTLIVR
jgi:uncharacterized cupredoxin-like copper-binding protein